MKNGILKVKYKNLFGDDLAKVNNMVHEGTKVLIQAENFEIEEKKGKGGYMVTGLALPFGKTSRNGINYNKQSIEASFNTLVNKPILFNHDSNALPKGHTTDVWLGEEGMYYRGDIDPEEKDLIWKMKRGDINNVSIQAIVSPTEDGEDGDVDIQEFLELSIVSIPGFQETTVAPEGFIRIEKLLTVAEPFGDYKDFDDCVSKNQGKDNPEAFCAWLQHKITGKWPSEDKFNTQGQSIKDSIKFNGEAETMSKEDEEILEKITKRIEVIEDKLEEQDDTEEPLDIEAEINEIKARLSNLEDKLGAEADDDDEEEPKKKPDDEEENVGVTRQSGTGATGVVKEKLTHGDVLDMIEEVS